EIDSPATCDVRIGRITLQSWRFSFPIFHFTYALDGRCDHQMMRCQRFCDLITDAQMRLGGGAYLDGEIAARVPARRQKVRMHDDVARAALHQTREACADVRLCDLKKGRLDQWETAVRADALSRRAHICVRLLPATAVPDDQYPALCLSPHADTSNTSIAPSVSNSAVVWRAMKAWKLSPALL